MSRNGKERLLELCDGAHGTARRLHRYVSVFVTAARAGRGH
jgi:hypothetical protein